MEIIEAFKEINWWQKILFVLLLPVTLLIIWVGKAMEDLDD